MSVRKLVRRDGSLPPRPFQARISTPTGERAKSFRTRREAERWERAQLADLQRGVWLDPRSARITVEQVAGQWLVSKLDVKAGTLNAYRGLLRSRVLPRWGATPVGAVTHSGVRQWVAALNAEGLSPGRVKACYLALGEILDLAVRDGRLAQNVTRGVPLPRKQQQRAHRYLSHADVAALAAAAGEHDLEILVLAYCGVRFGELAGLSCGDVDVLRGRLHVRANATEVGGRLIVDSPKSGRSRVVDVPGFLAGRLAEAAAGRDRGEPLFLAASGGRLRLSNWRARVWQPAVAKVGQHGLRVHDLRHTCASLAISAGASALAVAGMLGHASPTITLSTYSHLLESDARAVADRLDEARRTSDGRTSVTPLRPAR